MPKITRTILLCAVATLTAACALVGAPLAWVDVQGPELEVRAKQQVAFTATAYDEDGKDVTKSTKFTWTCEAGAGTIKGSGKTAKLTAGTVVGYYEITVTGRYSNTSESASTGVDIIAGPASKLVVIEPGNPIVVQAGDELSLYAAVADAYGNPVDDAGECTWSVSNGKAGTFPDPSDGIFVASTVIGSYTDAVVVTNGALRGKATVVITPPPPDHLHLWIKDYEVTDGAMLCAGAKSTLIAKAHDSADHEVQGLKFSFLAESFDIDWPIGTVNATSGAFTAGKLAGGTGNVIVQATYLGQPLGDPLECPIMTVPAAPKKIVVTPTSAKVVIGKQLPFQVQVFDSLGNVIDDATIAWSLTKTSMGQFDTQGLFTAGETPGTFKNGVVATATNELGSAKGSASLTILDGVTENDKAHAVAAVMNLVAGVESRDDYSAIIDLEDFEDFEDLLDVMSYNADSMANNYWFPGVSPNGLTTLAGRFGAAEIGAYEFAALSKVQYDQWWGDYHWTGSATYEGGGWHPLMVACNLTGVNEAGDTLTIVGDGYKGKIDMRGHITRDDARVYTFQIGIGVTLKPIAVTVNYTTGLDAITGQSMNLKAVPDKNGAGTTMSGSFRTVAEDGYSLSATMKSCYFSNDYLYKPQRGSMEFTATDKYTGTLTIQDWAYGGMVRNPRRYTIADIVDEEYEDAVYIHFVDGTISEPISYYFGY